MNLKKIVSKAYGELNTTKNALLNIINKPTMVILYHRVTNIENDPQMLAVSPDNFYQQVKFLRDNYNIVRFEDNWQDYDNKSIVITFDDGYEDNFIEALPILEDLKVPATFFISTGLIDSDRIFWWDELEYLIFCNSKCSNIYQFNSDEMNIKYRTESEAEIRQFYKEIHKIILHSNSIDLQNRLLNSVREWSKKDINLNYQQHRIMTSEQVKMMSKSRYTSLGAHTVNHASLSNLSEKDQRFEILHSKLQLEKITGHNIDLFSYPFGSKSDYTNQTIKILKECGIRKCASNYTGTVRNKLDLYQIPRNLVRNWSVNKFKENIERYWVL